MRMLPVMDGNSPLFSGPILVLEDNILVAMDAAAALEEITGCLAMTATTPAAALDMISRHDIAFAFLDIKLGNETSIDVAHALHERGVPFALVSGYVGDLDMVADYPPCLHVKKPFTDDMLTKAVAAVLG